METSHAVSSKECEMVWLCTDRTHCLLLLYELHACTLTHTNDECVLYVLCVYACAYDVRAHVCKYLYVLYACFYLHHTASATSSMMCYQVAPSSASSETLISTMR